MAEDYVLSGFKTQREYDNRNSTWEPDNGFTDRATAEDEARRWLAAQGVEAQVEIIRLQGREGTVVAVVTQSGTETIT